jgi:hypothetical protein
MQHRPDFMDYYLTVCFPRETTYENRGQWRQTLLAADAKEIPLT